MHPSTKQRRYLKHYLTQRFQMKSFLQITAASLFAIAAIATSTAASAATPNSSTGPFSYGKGETSLVANPSSDKAMEQNAGASQEQLLLVGKGETGAIVNPKAVQSKLMSTAKGQFMSVPGELGIVMTRG
jgi:hypothetical protein